MLLLPVALVWLAVLLAETNRTPYDFSEGESELVSGFNTEFGSGGFSLIFMAEYSRIIFIRLVTAYVFSQGGGPALTSAKGAILVGWFI